MPGDWDLEERRMFGMIMWMVRGHMFIDVSLSSQKLIVRVGEENVDPILAKHSAIGVEQCASADGARVYKGTIRWTSMHTVAKSGYRYGLITRWRTIKRWRRSSRRKSQGRSG